MSGEFVLGHALWQLLSHGSTYVPYQVGVYGASETGKTTLDMQLTTKGEIRPLGESDRTHHNKSSVIEPVSVSELVSDPGLGLVT